MVIVGRMQLALIVHDIRSCHNVGSLLRTADALGVDRVYLTGYTPYPPMAGDARLPHLREKIGRQIHKTALGAEASVGWSQHDDIEQVLIKLKQDGFRVVALEQADDSIPIQSFRAGTDKVALLLGREVEGIDPTLLRHADITIEIPMLGQKESLNVVQAAAIALYQCRYHADR